MANIINGAFSIVYGLFLALTMDKVLTFLNNLFYAVLSNGETGSEAIGIKMLALLLALAVGFGGIYALTIFLCQKVADFSRKFEE